MYLSFFVILLLGAILIASFMSQLSSAQTAAQIELKNLVAAHKNLQTGNTTGVLNNILSILDWQFKELHPQLEQQFKAANTTAAHAHHR
jgi:hypothetical protein